MCTCAGGVGSHRGLDRRRFLAALGMAGAGLGGLGRAARGDDPRAPRETGLRVGSPTNLCANAPGGGPYFKSEPETLQVRTKALYDKAKLWDPGQKVFVKFLNGRDDAWGERLRDRVRAIAPTWTRYAHLAFQFVDDGPCHLTLNFRPFTGPDKVYRDYGYYACFVGSDSLKYLDTIPSMSLIFKPTLGQDEGTEWLESEFRRVILHEFGHALGLVHEHQRPGGEISWNEKALRAHALEKWGWEKDGADDLVKSQILDAYKPEGDLLGSVLDPESIMMYEFSPGLATYVDPEGRKLRFEAPRNTRLSTADKVTISTAYPLPAPRLEEVTLRPGEPVDGAIEHSGQVARFAFPAKGGNRVMVAVEGPMPALVALLRNPPGDRGRAANILKAVEPTPTSPTPLLAATVPEKDQASDENRGVYYVEVRHVSPLAGTGRFRIRVDATT